MAYITCVCMHVCIVAHVNSDSDTDNIKSNALFLAFTDS